VRRLIIKIIIIIPRQYYGADMMAEPLRELSRFI